MAEFEFTFQGEDYVVNAASDDEALRKLQSVIGGQAAESMLPSPVDFGPAPPPRENVFGDVTSQAMEAPLEAMKYYAGRVTAPDRSILQRAGDVGMTALTGLGTGLAAGAGTVAEIVAGDTTQEKKLARDRKSVV